MDRFLHYVAASRQFTDYVLSVQTGTAVPHISGNQIREYEFLLPSLPEQRTIAHVLGTLDDKIELNRHMNETLEAMARALFKDWFVDFGPVRAKAEGRDPGLPQSLADLFPARLVDSDLGEIPEGWPVETLANHFEAVKGVSYKGSGLGDGGVPLHNLNSTRLLHKSWHVIVTRTPTFRVANALQNSPCSIRPCHDCPPIASVAYPHQR